MRNSASSQLLTNATIQLYRVAGGSETLIGSVRTNSAGQYLFADLTSDTYLVRASIPGYLSNQSAEVAIAGRQFAPLDIVLSPDPDANTGTVSGIIIDRTTGTAISNATVALYQITSGIENVVSITHTNPGGLYLFGDVPPGTYRIKATVQTEV
ncbi:collagen binding domain-containing protein [Paenibacillus lentus]|uniref:MSCRAMM family protein n=1 Tax=Paenibacillus lentus TaxID=1338368 RepID=UPI00365128BA